MKHRIFLVLFCLSYTGYVSAESLSEVYALALKNDYKLSAAQSAYLAGQESKNIALSRSFFPKVGAQAVFGRSRRVTKSESTNPFAFDSNDVMDTDSPGYTISLSQPLIDFSAFHNYKRGELAGRVAALQFESEKQSLIMRTADTYLQALTAGAKLAATEAAEDAFRLRLKAAKAKYEAGLTRAADYLEAQAALDSATANTIVAKNNLSGLFDALKSISGQDHVELAALPEEFAASPPVPADLQRWTDSAAQNNIEINIAKLRVEDAYRNSKSKAAEMYPKLAGQLSYAENYDRRIFSNAVPDKVVRQGFSATLVLTVPLYDGGGTSGSAREATYLYLAERDNSNGVNRNVIQKTHSTYLSVIAGVAAVNARKAAIVSSQRALTFAQKGYEEGIVSMINVLDAQRTLYEANQNYSDALYSYLIAGLKLKEIPGLLTSDDIDELSLRLDRQRKVRIPSPG